MNDLKNNSNNLPSVLQCNFNAKCFLIKEIYLLIGNCIGEIEIFNWFEEKNCLLFQCIIIIIKVLIILKIHNKLLIFYILMIILF